MTNAPTTRKTHVIRILGTNRNGDVLQDIWADIERIAIAKSISQGRDTRWQGVQRKHRWMDDPAADDYNPDGNPSRKTEIIKVCDPDGNISDPDEWVPVPANIAMRVKRGDQNSVDRYRNNGPDDDDIFNAARVVEQRLIYHYDTNIDADAQAAFDADPTLKAYVVRGEDYRRDDSTRDESQHVEAEVITYLKPRSNTDDVAGQAQQIKLLNQYLIDQSDPAKLDVVGDNGVNPPYRLDPYQNIININLSSSQRAVAGLLDINHFNSTSNPATLVSVDGSRSSWDEGFGAGSGASASGLGYTVVGSVTSMAGVGVSGLNSTAKLVAFGKPKNGDPCFIAVQGVDGSGAADIQRGVLDSGKLTWNSVASLPIIGTGGGAYSCVFAGDAFFISYMKDSFDLTTYLAVSFDGQRFNTEVQPFAGVAGVSNPDGVLGAPEPNPLGGCVAYDKKNTRYVTTGHFDQWQTLADTEGDSLTWVETKFMSSVSADGLSWSPHFDTGRIAGGGGNPATTMEMRGSMPSSVCFGKGVFVAASSYENPLTLTGGGGAEIFIAPVEACGIATSADGITWACQRLPGSISEVAANGPNGGDTQAVNFIKTRGTDENGYPNGFFVATGLEFTNLSLTQPFSHQTKFWFSENGHNWELVRTDDEKSAWIISAVNKSPGKIVFI